MNHHYRRHIYVRHTLFLFLEFHTLYFYLLKKHIYWLAIFRNSFLFLCSTWFIWILMLFLANEAKWMTSSASKCISNFVYILFWFVFCLFDILWWYLHWIFVFFSICFCWVYQYHGMAELRKIIESIDFRITKLTYVLVYNMDQNIFFWGKHLKPSLSTLENVLLRAYVKGAPNNSIFVS